MAAALNSAANDGLASIYLKALMEKYYDLRPGTSTAMYEKLQELIYDFGKPESLRKTNFSTFESTQKTYSRLEVPTSWYTVSRAHQGKFSDQFKRQ